MNRSLRLALPLGVLIAFGACEAAKPAPMAEKTLYDRLGGKGAITAVVDEFVARVAADGTINRHFAKTDIPKFKGHLVDKICQATGGPCKYTGRTMPETHKGMNITMAEFNATGGHLAGALDKFKVPEREKTELLTAIGGMADQIVGK